MMKDLFNLEFSVLFEIRKENESGQFCVRVFGDLSQADDFQERLKLILPFLKELFGCDFYCQRFDKVVFGTKKPDDNGNKNNSI